MLRSTTAGPGDAQMRKRLPCFDEEDVDGETGAIFATIEGSTGTWNPSGRSRELTPGKITHSFFFS